MEALEGQLNQDKEVKLHHTAQPCTALHRCKMVAQAVLRPSSLPDMRRQQPQGEGAPP